MKKFRRSSLDTEKIVKQFSQGPYDCRIVCKDGHVEAHCVILASASDYLKNLLMTAGTFGSAKKPALLVLPEYECKTVESIKKLIYEGETEGDMKMFCCASALQVIDKSL